MLISEYKMESFSSSILSKNCLDFLYYIIQNGGNTLYGVSNLEITNNLPKSKLDHNPKRIFLLSWCGQAVRTTTTLTKVTVRGYLAWVEDLFYSFDNQTPSHNSTSGKELHDFCWDKQEERGWAEKTLLLLALSWSSGPITVVVNFALVGRRGRRGEGWRCGHTGRGGGGALVEA
jgi:hypothetical protein